MNTETKINKNKLDLLKLAEELGNVSRACKYLDYSRDTFYHYKKLFETDSAGKRHIINNTTS
jgi:ACT domain-containing protein